MATWRNLLQRQLKPWGYKVRDLSGEDLDGALWELGAVWDRGSEAQSFPDGPAPRVHGEDVEMALEAATDRIVELHIWHKDPYSV